MSHEINRSSEQKCNVRMGGGLLEEVRENKYLESVLCNHGTIEGELKDKAVHGSKVIRSLRRTMEGEMRP